MRITAELSLYPLQSHAIEAILAFIAVLKREPGLEIVVNQLSTQIRGELDAVMGAVAGAMRASFAAGGGTQVLVAKFLSVDLPIATPPVLEAR